MAPLASDDGDPATLRPGQLAHLELVRASTHRALGLEHPGHDRGSRDRVDRPGWIGSSRLHSPRLPPIDAHGVVKRELAPNGIVAIGAELWNAQRACSSPVAAGQEIVVVAREGLTLIVEPVDRPTSDQTC